MIKFLKLVKTATISSMLFIFVASVVGICVHHNWKQPSYAEVASTENINTKMPTSHQKALKKSRQSAVNIISYNPLTGMMASSTGTYISVFDKKYVLTVMHGLVGSCADTKIVADNSVTNCAEFVTLSATHDYAIIRLSEDVPERTPVRVLRDIPHGHQWKKNLSVLKTVFYTGYPNNAGPLSFGGKIAGVTADDYLYVDSYAWAGASGSGVFSEDGKLIGYIMAIDVGETEFGIEVLENIIFVMPTYRIDWSPLFKSRKMPSGASPN